MDSPQCLRDCFFQPLTKYLSTFAQILGIACSLWGFIFMIEIINWSERIIRNQIQSCILIIRKVYLQKGVDGMLQFTSDMSVHKTKTLLYTSITLDVYVFFKKCLYFLKEKFKIKNQLFSSKCKKILFLHRDRYMNW